MKPYEKALAKRQQMKKCGDIVVIENNLIRKAKKNPTSLKKAIGAFCFHCFGGTEHEMPDPGWKGFIRECTAAACPLYPHRPYKLKRLVYDPKKKHSEKD